MEINLTPVHNTNQNECLIFAAEISNKHPFLTRCNRKHLGAVSIVRTCQFLFRLFMLRTSGLGAPSVQY